MNDINSDSLLQQILKAEFSGSMCFCLRLCFVGMLMKIPLVVRKHNQR